MMGRSSTRALLRRLGHTLLQEQTRLQADFYRSHRSPGLATRGSLLSSPVNFKTSLHHINDTLQILYSIRHIEGWRGLSRGLSPSVTGVALASAIKFYTDGNRKPQICEMTDWEPDAARSHHFCLVNTRLQLDKSRVGNASGQYKNNLHCVTQVLRQEGFKGLYQGLSASFLGVVENTLHLALYERHCCHQTRLRQAPMESGSLNYTGLLNAFVSPGRRGSFISPWLPIAVWPTLRAVPSAAITLGVYKSAFGLLGKPM
ncbi:mitochondrial carrier [Zopfia rhizophila CBS 207.26]|uniref:Mitochondrial carrier n=1 Tax=Zopfia rhizophila CBS 207.26 TaxID=1314779 RepID=A0A6A6E5V6_9PEZI|nr:mitochondrial carrier [Zopfia rhizophila CBS 207.26]